MKKLLAVVGPTGSGKSDLALAIAERLQGEIVSADSRQVFRFLDIGTSKPSPEDRKKAPHHFIDFLEPEEEYSAGAFGHDARAKIIEIAQKEKQAILVGGSGLYVRAVVDGLFNGPGRDPELRAEMEARLQNVGARSLFDALQKVDPEIAATMDPGKPRRIIRALEVYYSTGKPLSEFHKEQSGEAPFKTIQYALAWGRSELYARIETRVDAMLRQGLVEEVRWLQNNGYDHNLNALNSVGYKEVFDFLAGKTDYEQMVNLVKRNTRRFAKRQLTWFRADKRIHWLGVDESTSFESLADLVIEESQEK